MISTVIMVAAAAIIFAGGVLAGRRSVGRQTPKLNARQTAANSGSSQPTALKSLTTGDGPHQSTLRSILDALPVSITIIGPDGNYVFINRYEADRWGYDRDSTVGKPAYDVLPPEIAENARREDGVIFETGDPLPFFEEKSTIDGSEKSALIGKIPIRDDDGGIAGVCMIGVDITERLQVRDALKRSNNDYRRTLEFFPEAVYVTIEGRIVFANRTARNLFRSSHDEDIIDTPSIHLIHSDDHYLIEKDRQILRAGNITSEKRPYRYRRLDGSEFRGSGSATSITWDEKHAVLVVVHDNTAQLKRNAEIEEARRAADESNRAKSEFLASMSHEIRTPLNGILGMANLLRGSELDREQRKQVGIVLESGGLLLTLLNDILDLSKIEAGGLELESVDFDLTSLLDSLLDVWSANAQEKNLTYEHIIGDLNAQVLMADPTRIRQILYNLISNAVKFTATGEIRLRVSQTAMPDGLFETRFEVSDTGEGIPQASLKTLFAKFTQADSSVTRRHGGTGLGLSISKELVDAMGGEIGVDSTLGEGSTFWFTIVCPAGDPANVITDDSPVDTAGEARNLDILVAEDNEVNQLVIRAMLEKAGHRVTVAHNGREAVQAAKDAGFDVILMDIQMPEMDGISATREIRMIDGPAGKVPIVALTANAMKGSRQEYVGNGMDDYVSKPIDPQKLTAALRRQCGTAVSSPASIVVPTGTGMTTESTDKTDDALGAELSETFDDFETD